MYHPIPAEVPTISAVIKVKNEEQVALKNPRNILGPAPGITTWIIWYNEDVPKVSATSKLVLFIDLIPLEVINENWNQTVKAIRKTLAANVVGKLESANGSQATVGIGPSTLVIGETQ